VADVLRLLISAGPARPLQALVRNPPHRSPLCACGSAAASEGNAVSGLSAPGDLPKAPGSLAARARSHLCPQPKSRWRAPRRRSKRYGDERSQRRQPRTESLHRSHLTHAPHTVKRRRLQPICSNCRRPIHGVHRRNPGSLAGVLPRKWFLTVKLRGRPEALPKRRGRTLSPGARGRQTDHASRTPPTIVRRPPRHRNV
jgi:hypothetical protein